MTKTPFFTLLLLLAAILTHSGASLKACNNSSFTLVSMVESPPGTFTITTNLCFGYGRTGVITGGDDATNGISIMVYHPNTVGIMAALTSYTPLITVPFTAPPFSNPCDFGTQAGTLWGLGEAANIVYFNNMGGDLACISSTANCGNAGMHCQTVTLVYSGIYPDSLRAIGMEGPPPIGGCGLPTDQLISFIVVPVIWTTATATAHADHVSLRWGTSKELNTREFKVMRKASNGDWVEIGSKPAAGSSNKHQDYSFTDPHPAVGMNLYRILEVDVNGNTQESKILSVDFFPLQADIDVSVGPNPAKDHLDIHLSGLLTAQSCSLAITDLAGRVLKEEVFEATEGDSRHRVDLLGLSQGMYLLRVEAQGREKQLAISVR